MPLPFDRDPNEGRPLAGSGVPPGRFRLWRASETMTTDPWRLYCLLGDERPHPVRGYGGWGQKSRTGRRAVTTFEGSETPAYSIPLLIEARHVNVLGSASEKLRNLERLAGWDLVDDDPPPVVHWVANVAHDFAQSPQTDWVCEGLELAESNSTDRGTLLWMKATLTLAVYRETSIDVQKSKGFARKPLKVGWNLRTFAAKYLGDPKRWKDVAELNRDNPRCPSTPDFKPKREVWLLVPPREPKSKTTKRAKRGR